MRLVAILSTFAALWLTLAAPLAAHEVFPSIADMERDGDTLTFTVEANVESFLAGIDLAAVADTNDAAEADTYDSLRALGPDAMEDRFTAFWSDMADRIVLRAGDGTDLDPTLTSIEVPEVGNVETSRNSTIVFSVDLPPGTDTVQVGWDRAFGTLVVRQIGVDEPYDGFLGAGEVSPPIALSGGGALGPWATFLSYIPTGFDHIVPLGLDHILFVLGLFFLSPRLRPLLLQVTAFTAAHTITLALAALDLVSVPSAIVEPIIAASIVYVAVENIFSRGLSPWRPWIVFAFGLLHGLGFASVLAEFGLPDEGFVAALLGFNLGVEMGQLAVIAVAFLCVAEAIRVDRGANEARPALVIYAALAVVFAGLAVATVVSPAMFGGFALLQGEIPLYLFLGPMAGLFLLCALSVWRADVIESYRRIVAIPASAFIAVIGLWWMLERVLP